MLMTISLRIKSFLRRRHKFSLLYSLIIFIVIAYFIIVPNLALSHHSGTESTTNADSPTSNLIDDLTNDKNYLESLVLKSISYITYFITGQDNQVDKDGNPKKSSSTNNTNNNTNNNKNNHDKNQNQNQNQNQNPGDVIETLQQNEYDEEQKEQQEQDKKIELTPEQRELKKQEDIRKIRIIKDSMKKINSKTRYNYFQQIFQDFYDNRPQVPPLNNYLTSKRIYHARYDTSHRNPLAKKSKPVRIKKSSNAEDIITQDQDEERIIFSESYLNQFLQIDDNELKSMTDSHANLVANLADQAPPGVYKGDGIVFVGGGSFNWLTLLSVKSVRAMGSALPIEILIPQLDEYELDICARIYPALGARCIYLPYALRDPDDMDSEQNEEPEEIIDNEENNKEKQMRDSTTSNKKENIINKFKFKGYQYKALAILLSSFENVLLLDSDNIPVHKPDYLFSSEPFTDHGLIVWPDFWRRATSPIYYKIAGIEISHTELLPKYDEVNGAYIPYDSPPILYENEDNKDGGENKDDEGDVFYGDYDDYQEEQESESFLRIRRSGTPKKLNLKRIPLHQRKGAIPDPTSESGQLMISKKSHNKALLLALYYNLYGPDYFYPLFSQGSDGEGDKETFLAATVALQKPFYQVSKFLNAFGYFNSKNEFIGTGMGQYDPVEDYEYSKQWTLNIKNPANWEFLKKKDPLIENGPRILFVHSNFPKLNPWKLKTENKIIDKESGNRIRLYGTGMKVRTGYDFEYVQWTNMKFLLCDLKIELETFKKVNRSNLCKEIHEHIQFLKSTMGTME